MFMQPPKPSLVVIAGFSASGKSTLANELSKRAEFRGFRVIGSDHVRRDLWAHTNDGARPQTLPKEAYLDPEFKQCHYETVVDIAKNALSSGQSVILHGTMTDDVVMPALKDFTSENAMPFIPLWLDVPESELKRRIESREDTDGSDANGAVLDGQLQKGRPHHEFQFLDGELHHHFLADTVAGMFPSYQPVMIGMPSFEH